MLKLQVREKNRRIVKTGVS